MIRDGHPKHGWHHSLGWCSKLKEKKRSQARALFSPLLPVQRDWLPHAPAFPAAMDRALNFKSNELFLKWLLSGIFYHSNKKSNYYSLCSAVQADLSLSAVAFPRLCGYHSPAAGDKVQGWVTQRSEDWLHTRLLIKQTKILKTIRSTCFS